jgi:tricorn protease
MLIRNVAVNEQVIVFSYAGDLWKVDRSGGTALQLTEGRDDDDYPVLSRDGQSVAFGRRGADDWDVYVLPVAGGEASRLTYNPEADIPREWSASGDSVIFLSHRDEEGAFRLYEVARDGVYPTPLPFPRAWDASLSTQDTRIAYVPVARSGELSGSEWRYYRGGMSSSIWLVDLDDGASELLTTEPGNDRDPMWVNNTVYFVSDRAGTFNIFSYDLDTAEFTQLTTFETYGVESASAGGGLIAFVQDGHLQTFNLQAGTIDTVDVRVAPDTSEMQPRMVNGEGWIESATMMPSGNPVVFGIRGDGVTFDTETGEFENLTNSSGVAERRPLISPDGEWVAFFSDDEGEYQLKIRPTSGEGSVRSIPVELKPSFYRELVWSPDSKKLAFSDKELTLWIANFDTGGARKITTSTYSFQDRYQPAWSPDGSWLAYSRYEANRIRVIYLYHVGRGRRFQVTDGQVNSGHPAFDASGKYLYFVASNTAGLGEFGWNVLSGVYMRPFVSRRLNLVVLRQGMPSPVLPVIGDPNPDADSPSEVPEPRVPVRGGGQGRERPPPGGARPQQQVAGGQTAVSVANIFERIVPLPAPALDYAGLIAGGPGVVYALVDEWPDSPALERPPTRSLYRYDIAEPQRLERLIEGVDDIVLTPDGTQVLYRQGRKWAFVSTESAPALDEGVLDVSVIQFEVNPAEEWQQMYHESWRLMDDFFYDPDHHGQNVRTLERHFATYLPTITRRRDLNLLINKALGHVSASYLGAIGGDMPPSGVPSRIGMLGADYEIDDGGYRITRIYRSGQFNSGAPLLAAPLDQPGVYVEEGDYLLAVDGQPVSADRNIHSYFEGKAFTPTRITVTRYIDEDDIRPRTYTVVPLPDENALRRWNWAERNRRAVAQESQGILGYVYVPSFSAWGMEVTIQQILENADMRGLILDQRFAPGGMTADFLIELLNRTPLYYYTFRHGEDITVPTNPPPAAKVLLINDVNGTAAETFAFMFKTARAGTVIGTRTMGAGTGPYVFIPRLIDGGQVNIANRAAYNPAGSWEFENSGVEPDILVELTAADWWEARDPQLGTAIRTVLQMIVDNPPLEVTKPEYPVHQN